MTLLSLRTGLLAIAYDFSQENVIVPVYVLVWVGRAVRAVFLAVRLRGMNCWTGARAIPLRHAPHFRPVNRWRTRCHPPSNLELGALAVVLFG